MDVLKEHMESSSSLDELEMWHAAHRELVDEYSSILNFETKMDILAFEEDVNAQIEKIYDERSRRLIEEVM